MSPHIPERKAIRSPLLLLPNVTHRTFDSFEPKAFIESNRRMVGGVYLEHHLLMVVSRCSAQTSAQNIASQPLSPVFGDHADSVNVRTFCDDVNLDETHNGLTIEQNE